MKKNIAMLVICALLFGCALMGWQKFESKEGGFVVTMPGKPTIKTVKLPTDFGLTYLNVFMLSTKEGFAYFVSFIDYPGNLFENKTIDTALDEARDGIISNTQAQLLKEKMISIKGNPGREIEFQATNGATFGRVRLFVVKQRLYHIMVTTSKDKKSSYHINKFLDSFNLL